MPTRAQHLAQANRNRTLYEALGAQDVAEREWLVVLLFYAVLHVVEAWFANYGIHAKTHGERDARISTHPDLRVIYGRYRQLRIDSINARYNCWRPSLNDVQTAHNSLFQHVVAHVANLPVRG